MKYAKKWVIFLFFSKKSENGGARDFPGMNSVASTRTMIRRDVPEALS
ncbi:hypothetical protein [Lapidilactobacillus luobeiensis]|nr:hypothetical protein [Lapidilactobacillus luobeiensis]